MGDFGLTLELFLVPIALVVILLLAGVLYQWASIRSDARRFPPPGRLVDTAGCRLHIHVSGNGAPPVVFEAGIAATSLSWALVQPEIANYTQTVSYDRAGLGWSDPSGSARDPARVVEELRALLHRSGVAAPRVLVAHSYGALIARVYAARHSAEIAGLILLDPVSAAEWSHPSELSRRMLRRAILLSRRGATLARLAVVRLALNLLAGGARRLPRLVARASSGAGVVFTERIVGEIRKLPRELWPIVQAHWCDPKCFDAMAQYLEALPATAVEASQAKSLGEMPLTVLSAGNSSPAQRAEHERLVCLSTRGKLEIVPDSRHWIQLDRPDIVIRAIQDMLALRKSECEF